MKTKCIYCGSPNWGWGCPKNPHGKSHLHHPPSKWVKMYPEDALLYGAYGIFCQFENEELQKALEALCEEIGEYLMFGRPFSEDYIAFSSFVSIIDRNLLDEELWNCYAETFEELPERSSPLLSDTIYLIIDRLVHLKAPENMCIMYIDIKSPSGIPTIVNMVKRIKDMFNSMRKEKSAMDIIPHIYFNLRKQFPHLCGMM